MIRTLTGYAAIHGLLARITAKAGKALKRLLSFRFSDLLSEDMKYQLHFFRNYLPELYRRHVKRYHKNCLFCSRLIKSGCHRYCLKCGAGTYIKCCPPLPGLLYAVPVDTDEGDGLPVPWYFKKTCPGFKRLPLYLYWRNMYSVFHSIALSNYETLEGLERGLSSGTRPCHICATVDYGLYRRCTGRPDFDAKAPCTRIARELKKIYMSQPVGRQKASRSAV